MVMQSRRIHVSTRDLRATGSITMTTSTSSRPSSLRAFVVAIGLLLASLFAAGTASASTLIPSVSTGGSGGGGSVAGVLDESARSIDLIALSPGAATDLAASRGPLSSF
jgi:hypothetical protein